MKFVEEGDGQSIENGDYVPFPVEGRIHFTRISLEGGGNVPDERTLCGREVPDWRLDPTKYPIAGQVNCRKCKGIQSAREALWRGYTDDSSVFPPTRPPHYAVGVFVHRLAWHRG